MSDAMKRSSLRLALVTLLLTATSFAGKPAVHAPLPAALMEAKTVYIQNDSGFAALGDRCFEALSAWGRFKIVANPNDADLVFLLTAHSRSNGYSGTTTAGQNGTSYTNLSEDRINVTTLAIVGTSNKQTVWTDTRKWGIRHAATTEIIKSLRKRFEEQEAENKEAKK